MKKQTNFDKVRRINRQLLIKLARSLVKFEEKEFVDPVENCEENASEWVK